MWVHTCAQADTYMQTESPHPPPVSASPQTHLPPSLPPCWPTFSLSIMTLSLKSNTQAQHLLREVLFFTLKVCKRVHPSIMWWCRMYIQDQKYGAKSRSHQKFFNNRSEARALTRRRKNGSTSSLESRTDVKADQQWRSINHWCRQCGLFFTTANERCCAAPL